MSAVRTEREDTSAVQRPRDGHARRTARDERIVVAMSGGVDSSVAAALLAEQGHDVIGISLRLAPHSAERNSSGCCSIEDFQDAARVARSIGIPHYVFDMREEFERDVIRPFVGAYLSGRTPSPCILCNREIKFGLLHRKAAELGAAKVATGHYARITDDAGTYRLLRGLDRNKDQSYFLFEMGQRELARTLFPVGAMEKHEVRAHAARLSLPVADKPESQEVCFVPDGRYAEFVARAAPERVRAGAIRDEAGRVLGAHEGVHAFTIGQRRGIGVSAPMPLYVSKIDAASGDVTVAERGALACTSVIGSDPRWVSDRPESVGARIEAKIRYRHTPASATLMAASDDGIEIRFDEAQYAITPGQATVLYRGDEVVGGAWIASGRADREDLETCA
jgi:tRNA-specific 2-thiouridylase